jgi:hypothetical protein
MPTLEAHSSGDAEAQNLSGRCSMRCKSKCRSGDFAEVRIQQVRQEPERPFDVSFELISGTNRICVFGEIKQAPSPKMLAEIGPWKRRMKSLKEDAFFAVVAPALSPLAQADCVANEVDFLDLAGSISIRVPGKFTLQRRGRRSVERYQRAESPRSKSPFSWPWLRERA